MVWLPWLVLFGVAIAIRLHQLGYQPLWLDEGETWARVTGRPIAALILDLFRPTQAYPLYHLLLKIDTRLLGDSEWALRLPSAIAGSLAVPAIYALGRELRGTIAGIGAALLLLVSPFAIWQSQDAKAYSLVLLHAILLAWTFARALRANDRRRWLVFAAVALLAPFTHRLLVFTLIGCGIAWGLTKRLEARGWGPGDREGTKEGARSTPDPKSKIRNLKSHVSRWVLFGSIVTGVVLVEFMAWSLRAQNAGGQFANIGPLRAAWLTFGKFSVDQWPGVVPRLWLLPFALLTLIGGAALLWDATRYRSRAAIVVLALGGAPTLLFASLLLRQPVFEARYLTIVFPFWLIAGVWGLGARGWGRGIGDRGSGVGGRELSLKPLAVPGSWFLVLASLLVSCRALYLPDRGIFSGAIVKENYRDAVRDLALRVHPDDLVIVHPDTIRSLYRYYAARVEPRTLDEPTVKVYPEFGRAEGFDRKEWENKLFADLQNVKRAWLLVAPDHAALVDEPNRAVGDRLGLVGLAFQYGDQNGRWQCGPSVMDRAYAAYNGVLLYCNTMPAVNGQAPQPENPLAALFGDDLRLRGYTITPFASEIRSAGTLPLSLFWQPTRSLAGSHYSIFVHLTRSDDPTPLAQIDGPPLEGGLPTDQWTIPGDEIHDERTMRLVDNDGNPIPPGRYVLRLGVYDAQTGERLPISDTSQPVEDDALILGEIVVQAAQ